MLRCWPLIAVLTFLLFPLFLHAQNRQGVPVSNLRLKKLAVGRSDTLKIDSLSLVHGTVHITGIPDADFIVLHERARIVWKQKPAMDSVQVAYRVLPFDFYHTYQHKSARMVDSNVAFLVYRQNDLFGNNSNKNFVDFNQIEYNGSYGRSISLGNNQDVVLNSHFNLQVNGYLLDSVKLEAAITDNSIPFQPEGNTQRLQEFDQIYIHLSKGKHDLMLGDFSLEKPPGYFLNFYKRVQGLYYQTAFNINKRTVNKLGLSGSIAKGQFARNIFQGLEGNQGPYKLTGNNGEQFFIILAGTERVFINDRPMERGENADYIINYNTGEIRFMPRQMITKDSRIQVEFEYQDKNYLNSLIYAYDEVQVGKKWNIRFNAYSNQDAKNQPYLQNLSGDQKRFLEGIGDSIQNAFYPVINRDTFAANKILYRITDTTVGSAHYDSVFVYSVNPDSAIYNLSFSFVGAGKGNYIISNNNANGRVYNWTAPLNGQRTGDYEPVQLIVTPKKTQVFTLGTTYNIDTFKTLYVEVGASNTDPNLFSKQGDNTHWGLATRINYTEQRFLGPKDTLGHKKWTLQNSASYEYVQDRFQAIAPYRNVEFGRDWNVPQSGVKPDEHLASFATSLQNQRLGTLSYNLGYYQRGTDYLGYRNVLSYLYNYKQLSAGGTANMLNARDTFQTSVYWRPSLFAEYKIKALFNTALGARYQAEQNALRDKFTDTLRSNAFSFDITSVYLRSPQPKPVQFVLDYSLRNDRLPRNNQFQQQSHSHNVELQLGVSKWKNHLVSFTGTYRKLQVDDSSFTTQKPEESLLGRLSYTGNLLHQAIMLNSLYEFGSGQEQKRSYTYVEVPAGQGIYTWIDYNGDGVQQANEFEVALYPDQKKFIRVFTPTNEYVKVNYVNFSQSVSIDPANFWKTGDKLRKWQKFVSRFSDQASLQISNRLLADEGLNAYNPFLSTQNNNAIIITNTSLNNSVYYNRTNVKWGIDYNFLYNAGKQLLTYGIEGNSSTQHLAKLRWNMSRSFTLNISGREGQRAYQSALQDNRTYKVDFWSAEPSLVWLHRSVLRITTSLKYDDRRNRPEFGGEKTTIQSVNLEMRWSQPSAGIIQVRGTYSEIKYDGLATAPASFVMLDALQNGSNYLWYANWERKVSKGIELSLEYEGRKPGGGQVIHTGRMSLRAIL